MPLSDSERHQLDELERSLYRSEADEVAPSHGRRSRRRILLGILLAALGMALLVVSIPLKSVLLGVLSFLVMVLGLVLITTPGRGAAAPQRPDADAGPKPGAAKPRRAGLTEFMRDRWNRRDE